MVRRDVIHADPYVTTTDTQVEDGLIVRIALRNRQFAPVANTRLFRVLPRLSGLEELHAAAGDHGPAGGAKRRWSWNGLFFADVWKRI